MPTITILNHGTSNSSDEDIVISRLKTLMDGVKNGSWKINTGVGTLAQAWDRHYMPGWNTIGGIVWAKGLSKNVEDSVAWVRMHCENSGGAANVRVNLAGHSRGSMTALKIAHRLQDDPGTMGCTANLFLIDPVPGNLGWVNAGMYKDIAIKGKIANAYMFLAESERRNAFKPYVDKMFLQGLATHRVDTIPGNHGGINALGAKKHQAADIVLHHAVKFLSKHGTPFVGGDAVRKTKTELVDLYAAIMLQFQDYKHQGRTRKNLVFQVAAGGVSSGDRKVQVHNEDKKIGMFKTFRGLEKDKFDSKPLKGMTEQAASKTSRFFANADHKRVFRHLHGTLCGNIELVEQANSPDGLAAARDAMSNDAAFVARVMAMGVPAREHFWNWYVQVGGQA